MDVQLVVVKGNPRGRTLKLSQGEFLIGRGAECYIRPDSEWVSRQHCLLTISEDQIHLKDLASTNGTLVNGQRLIGVRDLVHGDTVQVGPLVLQLRLPSQEADLESMKQTDLVTSPSTVNEACDLPSQESAGRTTLDASENAEDAPTNPLCETVEQSSYEAFKSLEQKKSE